MEGGKKLKIIALTGLLGYGYSEIGLHNAFLQEPDIIGVDAGSIDPGPFYLGSGESFTSQDAVKRDLELVLPKAVKEKIPFIVGTAGGSGSKKHVEWLLSIIDEISEKHSLTYKMCVIYSDVSQEYMQAKFGEGKIKPMGSLELSENSIQESNRIVAQLSIDPVIKALDDNADVIICGRLCDTAIYAAPAIRAGYDKGLAFHMAKIIECGSMCCEPLSASDVICGEIFKDNFVLTPMNPIRKCTVSRVAAHTMYEQADPCHIIEPDGSIDLQDCSYIQIDDKSVKVSGSRFSAAEIKTLKIEGTRMIGFRTISIAGINDPVTITRIDEIFNDIKDSIRDNFAELKEDDYALNLRKYGASAKDVEKGCEANLGVIIDVVGKNKDISAAVCSYTRSRLLHYDYTGRKSTAGNLAFPYSPSDIKMGEVYSFSIYHLCEVDDLMECAKITYRGYINGKTD